MDLKTKSIGIADLFDVDTGHIEDLPDKKGFRSNI